MKTLLFVTASDKKAGAEFILERIWTKAQGFNKSLAITRLLFSGNVQFAPYQASGLFGALGTPADIIFSQLFWGGLFVRIRRMWDARFQWIHVVHYADYNGQKFPRLRSWLDHHFIFPNCDRLIAVSPVVYRTLKNYPQAEMIMNGVDLQLKSEPKKTSIAQNKVILGCVSMLRKEKGLDRLIELLAQPGNEHVHLQIAGDGPEKMSLYYKTLNLGLSHRVKFLGFVQDIHSFYNSIDIYIQPSLSESFGVACLEAMQYSLPIVATNVGNLPDLLQKGEFGILVSSDSNFLNETSIAIGSISERINEYRERSYKGLLYWQEKLSSQKMLDQYSELFKRFQRPAVAIIAPIITHSRGGMQKQIWLQTKYLSQNGYLPYLIQRNDADLASKTDWSHVEFLQTWDPPLPLRLRGAFFVVAAIWKLYRNRKKFVLMHAHQLFSPTLVGAIVKKLTGIPLVTKVTASGKLGEVGQIQKLPFRGFRNWAFSQIDQVLVLSDEMETEVQSLGIPHRKIQLLPNAVQVDELKSIANPSKVFSVLYSGRLSKEKCLHTLVAACGNLQNLNVPVELHLLGASDKERDVKSELEHLQKTKYPKLNLKFHGHQKNVTEYYQQADVFVLPSSSEGMSNALLEAMSHGLPCVVSDIAPNRFLLNKETTEALFFEVENIQELQQQLYRLWQDKCDRGALLKSLSQKAYARVRAGFSIEVLGKKLSSVYASISGIEGMR